MKWGNPGPEAEAVLCFDIQRLASSNAISSPIVIFLDSMVLFDRKPMNIGRIELDNFNCDTARFLY